MADIVFLDFEIHLRDEARVLALQGAPPGETSLQGAMKAIIRAPLGASEEFGNSDNAGTPLPLVRGYPEQMPADGPYIFSRWFSSPASDQSLVYPLDAATFVRKSGGWFGIPLLFGKTVRFYWRGSFFYDPPRVTGDPADPGTIRQNVMKRRWIDPGPGNMAPNREGLGTSEMSRDAGAWTDTFGFTLREQVFARTHTMTDFTGGVANQVRASWERLYIRLRRVGGETLLWKCENAIQQGVQLNITPTGAIALYHVSGATTLIASTPVLEIDRVYKLDLAFNYGDGGAGFAPEDQPGVFPGARFTLFLDGVAAINFTPPGDGLGAAGFHLLSRIGPSAAGETSEVDVAFWMNARNPQVYNGIDFLNGSRPALLRPKAFTATHANWTGDVRLLSQFPIQFQHTLPILVEALTSTTALAEIHAETDADRALVVPGAIGVAAIMVTHVGHWGTTQGQLGYKAGAAAAVLQAFNANGLGTENGTQDLPAHHRFMYAPTPGPFPVLPETILPFELQRIKGNDATISRTYQLMAVAELIGVFQTCDYPAGMDEALRYPLPYRGVHNAPYPRTPWAESVAPPYAPVVIKSGTYVGNGLGQDLLFPAPVNWLWIRKASGAGNPTMLRWWSSMHAPSVGGMKAPHAFLQPNADVDPGFVPVEQGPPTGGGAMPNRSAEVAAIVAQHPQYFDGTDDSRRDLVGIVARDLNATIPADGNNWGLLIKNDRTPPFIPVDIIVWKPTLEHVDVLSATAAIWIEHPAIPPEWAWHPAGFDGQQQTRYRVRIAGNHLESNLTGETYCYTSVADPGMRFLLNGAMAFSDEFLPRQKSLIVPGFTALGALIAEHRQGNYGAVEMFFKGPGHAATAMNRLDAAGASVNGITLGAGTIQMEAAFGAEPFKHAAFALVRSDDGSGDVGRFGVFGVGSYVGNGAATRDIAHTVPGVSNKRPLWILVAPNGAQGYVKDCQMPATTAFAVNSGVPSVTAIIGADLNVFKVGSTLNTDTVLYHYMIIWGGTVAGNGGMSECGEFWPVPPDRPPCVLLNIPCDPEPPPIIPPPGGGGGGQPPGVPGGGPDDMDKDCTVACQPFTSRIANIALQRIGISRRMTNVCTDVTEDASVMRTHYARAVEETLRDFPWPFATRYAALSVVGGTSTTAYVRDWQYAYRVPTDCVFARRIAVVREGAIDPTAPPHAESYDTVGGLILTNQASAILEYTARPECTAQLGEPLFVEALEWKLAGMAAIPLSKIEGREKYCLDKYDAAIAKADSVIRPGNPGARVTANPLGPDVGTGCEAANVAVVNRALVRIGARSIANLLTEQSREAESARLIFEEELRSVLRDFAWPFCTQYDDTLVHVYGPASAGANVLAWSLATAYLKGEAATRLGVTYYARQAHTNQQPPNATYWTTTAPTSANSDWTYAYRYPTDCVDVRRIVRAGVKQGFDPAPAPFRVGQDARGLLLFTEEEAPTIEYTARINCVVKMGDALFRDALAWRLAACLAPALAQVDPAMPEQLGRGVETKPRERKATEAQLRERATRYAWAMYAQAIAIARANALNEAEPQDTDVGGDPDWIRGRN